MENCLICTEEVERDTTQPEGCGLICESCSQGFTGGKDADFEDCVPDFNTALVF